MSSNGRVSYEVQTYDKGRWVLSEQCPTEPSARRKAEELLTQKTITGVRIVKESHFGSDSRRETEIFKEIKQGKKDEDFTVLPIESASVCDRVADYYKKTSRATIGRLLTKYIEKFELTPLELLHSSGHLKRIMNLDGIVSSAVDKVATLQARLTGEDVRKRRDVLFAAVDAFAKRAREAEGQPLPDLKGSTLGAVLAAIDGKVADPEERQFLATIALVKVSLDWRGWIGKIDGLLGLSNAEEDQRSIAMIDEMVADILAAPAAIKDVMGVSKHMGDAIIRILDLTEGKCKPTQFAAPELLKGLNEFFAEGRLPLSKEALFDRLQQDLKGTVLLTGRGDAAAEKDFFETILTRAVSERGVVGGCKVALGLADRGARLENVGGASGRRKGIESVCTALASSKLKVVYLLALYDEDAKAEDKGAIEIQVRDLITQLDTIKKIAPTAQTQKARLQEVVAIQKLILDSRLEDRLKLPLAEKLDGLVANYLINEKVIQRLNGEEVPFRERANRLLNFCRSGVLTAGKATTIAHDSVISYLKRQDFISEFTADIADPEQKKEAIMSFYKLLTETGFSVPR